MLSHLVADFKYSQEHGVKICEVQHGSLSAVDGDLYVSGGDGSISPKIADFFARFPVGKWAVGLIYPPLKRSLAAKGWDVEHSIKTLLNDPIFLKYAASRPVDPFSVTSHSGIVYGDLDVARHFCSYRKAYPGILFINAPTFPYWRDKFKMNALFDHSDELKQYKAEWRLYPKTYDSLLSGRIQEELPSEFYVIKPRSETLGNGVIVVAQSDLDSVLKMILDPSSDLERHPDKKYSYWQKNRNDTFLIEKYYESDPLHFRLPLEEKILAAPKRREAGYHYDATMRMAFILQYDGGKTTYHSLGAFWKLPSKALEEEGTLNEKRIAFCRPPFYRAVDPELLKEVDAQIERAMLLLYETMLNGHSQLFIHGAVPVTELV
jgi:hypothetical protein